MKKAACTKRGWLLDQAALPYIFLNLGQRHPLRLVLVFTRPILIGGFTGIPLKEEQLADAFFGIDAAIGTGGITEL
jgi:hypothetical protein